MCFACDHDLAAAAGIDPCLCGAPETIAAYHRLEADVRRRAFLGGAGAMLGLFAGFGLAPREVRAQEPGRPLLLTNLSYFDGETLEMQEGRDILIQGGLIAGLPTAGSRRTQRSSIAADARSFPG